MNSIEIYPDACSDLIFEFNESTFRVSLGGSMQGPHRVNRLPHSELWSLRFEPGWTPLVGDFSPSELVGHIYEVDSVLGQSSSGLCESLYEASSDLEKTRLLSSWAHQLPYYSRDPLIQLVAQYKISQGSLRIPELVRKSGYSERQLERRFKDLTGFSPKRLGKILRFNSALRKLITNDIVDWADFAAELGWYDQSHMINDFKSLSGKTPQELFSAL